MKNQKTKIGLIKFTNCLPVNYGLERQKPENTKFIYGTPAYLNKLMAEKKIDIAPISSFEYLKNKDKYTLIKTACISSDEECGSVLLFSRKEIKNPDGGKIGIPCDSASSTAMLKIILNEYDIDLKNIIFETHNYAKSVNQFLDSDFDAVLFIGDNALKNNYNPDKSFSVYDIGTLWKKIAGYPAIFGTWVARNDWVKENKDSFKRINNLIPKAIATGLGMYFNEILYRASCDLGIKEDFIRTYLTEKIKYNFTIQHEKSLELFEKLYKNLQKTKSFIL